MDDLEEHLSRAGGKLTQTEAVSLMRQCLRGLSAAHSQGVVHRDLKPSNLYVAADGTGRSTLKILDFGVAKSSGDAELTSTGVIVGTPAYMAPEQARGAIYADQRSDVYAAGAVLYRMITGKSPYSETDAGGTLMRLMEGAPPRPSLIERQISPGLEAVIERAMARDPAQRFQNVEELDAALAPFDGGASSTLTSAVTTKQLDRHARLTRPLAVLLTVSLALACGLSTAAVLSLFVQGLSRRAQLNTTELVLVILGAAVATVATGMTSGKALADAWRNVAAVQTRTRKLIHAVCVGLMTLGALELASQLWLVFVVQAKVTATPFWVAARVLVALLAASLVTLRAGSQRLSRA
jgi:serine/threonine-protein kinase